MNIAVGFACLVALVLGSSGGVAGDNCDCTYTSKFGSYSGCHILTTAPPGKACECSYDGAWTCSGSVVGCLFPDSATCSNPTTSKDSCLQGGGECGGYGSFNQVDCDCSYTSKIFDYSGCHILTVAPPNNACKCSYDGGWTCSGSVVPCRFPNENTCSNPTTSYRSCLQGGGECEGYTEYK